MSRGKVAEAIGAVVLMPGARALVSATAPLLSATKNIRRSDSVSNLAENGSLPLHSHPASIPIAPFVAESRRSSIVNLLPSQPTSNEVFDSASSPLLTALKADLTAAQSALSEVKSQLHALEESVSTAHSSLQTSLDEVRSRRKEDDGERQELKSRTKGLEEQKRQAEAARREAEKKLKAIEGVRDGLESKIQAALNEIQDFKGLVDVSTRAVRTVQEEGARFLIETRENVERRREELEEVEGDIGELDARNEELGRAIQEAEEKVEEARRAGEEAKKLGPEEEMMMMAAAYEAAAQEGYGHAGQHPGSAHAGQIPGHSIHAHGGHVGHAHAFGNRNVNGNNSSGGANTMKPSACPAYQSRQADQKPMLRTAVVMTAANSAVTAGTMTPQTTRNAVTSATDWKRPNRGNTLRISHAAPTASIMQSSGRPTPVRPLNPNSCEEQIASGVQASTTGAQRRRGVTWSRANSTAPASHTTAMPPSKRVSTSASDAQAKYASAVPSTSPGYHLLRRYDS